MRAVGDTLFFTADDGSHGTELWTSDGTEPGTVMVKDLRPGEYDGNPEYLTAVGENLFFTARDGVHGPELWKSDGTEPGTVLVKDITPGAGGYNEPSWLTGVGEMLFLAADDGTHGNELWKSDGSGPGTVMVKDVNAGGDFFVNSKGRADTANGTMRVKVRVDSAGTLEVRPAGQSKLKRSVRDVDSAGNTTITLTPTRAGMRVLRKEGKLRVKARVTFTPCGGSGSSVTQPYTLRLK